MTEITNKIYYVGVNDRNKHRFEGLWPLPNGVSYNSYIIDDEKVALVDTVEVDFFTQFLENIHEVIGDREIDYLIINHMEPDHSGSIALIKKYYPNIKIVGNKKTLGMLEGFYGVTDDVVEIRKVSDDTLVGSAPDITRHFIELRGIGIVDVKSMFGVQSVRETQNIDLVITLEDWSREKEYDRLGLEETYTEFLGNKVVCHNIPIRPGRNLAIIVESAAVNHRQKQMGYNAAQELYKRVQNSLTKRK